MEKRTSNKLGRIMITLLGLGFILWSLGLIALGFIGEKDTALITNIRRSGGQRNESIPNRYTYVISYSFKLSDGSVQEGFTYKVGSAVYTKASGNSLVPVRYIKNFPTVNALESDTGFSLTKVLLTAVGVILVVHKKAED